MPKARGTACGDEAFDAATLRGLRRERSSEQWKRDERGQWTRHRIPAV
jgi:hypothetical protein